MAVNYIADVLHTLAVELTLESDSAEPLQLWAIGGVIATAIIAIGVIASTKRKPHA